MRRRMRPALAECHECQLPIRFVRLDTGKPIPVDPQPNNHGNVAAYMVGRHLHGHVVSRTNPIRARMNLYMPHHATCPERKENKRPQPDPTLF